jgi:hypothetical protein
MTADTRTDNCDVRWCDEKDGHLWRHAHYLGDLPISQGMLSLTVEAERGSPADRLLVMALNTEMPGSYVSIDLDWPQARQLAEVLDDARRRFATARGGRHRGGVR